MNIVIPVYSGHLSIADTIAGSRRITHFLHIKIHLHSGQLYSGHLSTADTFSRSRRCPLYTGMTVLCTRHKFERFMSRLSNYGKTSNKHPSSNKRPYTPIFIQPGYSSNLYLKYLSGSCVIVKMNLTVKYFQRFHSAFPLKILKNFISARGMLIRGFTVLTLICITP